MSSVRLRGLRGAITVSENSKEEIVAATRMLLEEMVRVNEVEVAEIASCIFSVTPDLNAEFPAMAARQMGWQYTPLLCTNEVNVEGALPRCIRVLLHVNTVKPQEVLQSVYLRAAKSLRPDHAGRSERF